MGKAVHKTGTQRALFGSEEAKSQAEKQRQKAEAHSVAEKGRRKLLDGAFRRLAGVVGCEQDAQRKTFILKETKEQARALIDKQRMLVAELESRGIPVPAGAYYEPPAWYHDQATPSSRQDPDSSSPPDSLSSRSNSNEQAPVLGSLNNCLQTFPIALSNSHEGVPGLDSNDYPTFPLRSCNYAQTAPCNFTNLLVDRVDYSIHNSSNINELPLSVGPSEPSRQVPVPVVGGSISDGQPSFLNSSTRPGQAYCLPLSNSHEQGSFLNSSSPNEQASPFIRSNQNEQAPPPSDSELNQLEASRQLSISQWWESFCRSS